VGKNKDKEMCFVIMPFSDPEDYEKGHFTKIYEQLIKPAIEEAGYEPHREDDDSGSTLIHGNIFDNLINAPMVLCDLSTKNPNVLYELGIRHAFDKPVVLICEEGQSSIFDIAGVKTTSYRKERLYDEVLEDQKRIEKAITETRDLAKNFSFMKLVKMQPAVEVAGGAVSNEMQTNVMLKALYDKLSNIEKNIGQVSPTVENVTSAPPMHIAILGELSAKIVLAEEALDRYERSGKEKDKYVMMSVDKELGDLISEATKLGLYNQLLRKASVIRRKISEKI
jgi:hypothetical protein